MTHANTRIIRNAYRQYLASNACNLAQVYRRYSIEKARAFGYCQYLAQAHNIDGTRVELRILSHNTSVFSVGFMGVYPHPKTGELLPAFFYITRDHNRYIFLHELNK